MWYIICYLIVGDVSTMLLYQPEPEETLKDLIVDAVIGILTWPYLLVAAAIETLRGEDGD